MYRAIDVAKYIVTICARKGNPVSNLKLQKMLYFVWIFFFKETNIPLFNDKIFAWQLGPVVPEVYYEFCSFAGIPITRSYSNIEGAIGVTEAKLIDSAIDKYLPVPASTLVNMTHQPGKPWSLIYKDGIGLRDEIPFELIISLEVINEN